MAFPPTDGRTDRGGYPQRQACRACRAHSYLGVGVERLQDVVILGRDVAVLQLQQRRVRQQVDAAPLGGRRGLSVPQPLQVSLRELRLRIVIRAQAAGVSEGESERTKGARDVRRPCAPRPATRRLG